MSASYPTVRLRPKANRAAIRHGFPWVYADELVTDRRTRALTPGAFARLEDAERQPLGTVTVNPASTIIARVLDTDPAVMIDAEWLRARIVAALSLRENLYDAPFYRLVHAEADGLPGLVIDRFGEVFALQPNAAWADAEAGTIAEVLADLFPGAIIHKNASGRARAREGLDDASETLIGTLPGPVSVPMNGATYLADIGGGQKTGLFFDQRPNHAFAATLGRGGAMLDVFSHVGGFALAALAAGAETALAVDGSAPALELAAKGAEATGVAERFSTRQGDAFDVMTALAEEGRKFQLVVCDPPAFAPSRQALEAGLRAYERVARLAAPLVAAGGYVVLCSCSHAADLSKFRTASARGLGKAGRRAQIIYTGFAGPDHPQLPQLAESGYLKALAFRLD